ncbi:hypothetical protein LNKW23_42210 [Paralimibaculum aggregatum]|uniref:ApeI dehydratase-like domain-containing protein n=1 Tax=Paralimibaculum aggregatum TaxID=3036245 RepID=A0ABQ6LSE8_9RHOB|nr:hypothetical protein [Limibaculum sp. NKW23]GMG85005.1 hypothetical protein LNKW23_42210 [Limibaculum sp. NKW23]
MAAAPQAGRVLSLPQGIPAEAACLDGHFPGRPVVPAAVLLGEALAWLAELGHEVRGVRRVKFVAALGPGEPFEIRAVPGRGGLALRWLRGDTLLAEGSVTLAPADG